MGKMIGTSIHIVALAVFLLGTSAGADTYFNNEPHEIRVLNSGLASLAARLDLIDLAKESISLEYYIFAKDESGKLVTDALLKRASEGIKVRVLVDKQGAAFDEFDTYELKQRGVEVKVYNDGGYFRMGASNRDHRKILMIDGKEVISGGRNIENTYFDLSAKYDFLDRDTWVKGPIVSQIQADFDAIWNDDLSTERVRPDLSDVLKRLSRHIDPNRAVSTWNARVNAAIQFASTDAKLDDLAVKVREEGGREWRNLSTSVGRVYYTSDRPRLGKANRFSWALLESLLVHANHAALCEVSYVTLGDLGYRFLENLKHGGIQVTLLTNSAFTSDANITSFFMTKDAVKMDELGLKTLVSLGQFPADQVNLKLLPEAATNPPIYGIHSKSCVTDSGSTFIGSFNFDPRSLHENIENGFVFPENPEIAKQTRDSINERIKYSNPLVERDRKGNPYVLETKETSHGFGAWIKRGLQKIFYPLIKGFV